MAHTLTLHVPYPPSVNSLWRSVGNRVLSSADYKKWKREAVSTLCLQARNVGVFGAYELKVQLTAMRKRGDTDNRLKPVNDALQAAGIVVNDKYCTRATVERADTGDHDCILVISGDIAFANRWEFAKHKAASLKRRPGRR